MTLVSPVLPDICPDVKTGWTPGHVFALAQAKGNKAY